MTTIGIGQSITTTVEADRLRPVRLWLYVMALLVLLMVAVGGVTRLTGSGLSITSWEPISGVIPPLSDAAWQAEFDHYKQIPQYSVDNPNMTLEGFKAIFWPEWGHRLLGRLLGLVFAVPFVVFLVQRRFSWKLAGPLAVIFLAGGLQGLIGWWMVSSGLENLTSVSQYRLATHLTAALVLFLSLIWVGRSLEPSVRDPAAARTARWPVAVLLALVVLQIA
ncbi:MAG TPA: COX15/CtaA family protein, partial [Devosiaceae bacterium]|nr:COX15/CtaA family protein [Devosiaceae bacterium]